MQSLPSNLYQITPKLFKGKMTAQTPTKNNPKTDVIPFNITYPVGFNLLNDQYENVLYIDSDANGQDMHFSVTNQSKETIVFNTPTDKQASSENYHLELKFRPGTLVNWDKIALAESSDWSFQAEHNGKGTGSLYFLRTSELKIKLNDSLDIKLQKVSADPGGGSRSTRFELKYRNLKYEGAPDTEKLEGTRIKYLSIINHRGKKNIPLHVGFYGSNTVLNDGISPNELELRITNTNTDPKSPPLFSAPSGGGTPQFTISFDSGDKEKKFWALGTVDEVKGINAVATLSDADGNSLELKLEKSQQGESPQWTISIPDKTELGTGESITVKLSNIITGHSPGRANVYVRYENIPGYWDGEMIVVVNKSPLLYSTSNNVGIGTTNPEGSQLKVEANSKNPPLRVEQTGSGDCANFGGRVAIGSDQAVTGDKSALYVNANSGAAAICVEQKGAGKCLYIEQNGSGTNSTSQAIWVSQNNSDTALYVDQKGSGYCAKLLGKVQISGKADLQELDVSGKANLQELQVTKTANVQELQVTETANLQGLQVNGGTVFKKVLAGSTQLPLFDQLTTKDSTGMVDVTKIKNASVKFPEEFSGSPYVIVTVRNQSSEYSDVFAVTVSDISQSEFTVNIVRADLKELGTSWGQYLNLDWIAWEI